MLDETNDEKLLDSAGKLLSMHSELSLAKFQIIIALAIVISIGFVVLSSTFCDDKEFPGRPY